jgi:hypothetical protein
VRSIRNEGQPSLASCASGLGANRTDLSGRASDGSASGTDGRTDDAHRQRVIENQPASGILGRSTFNRNADAARQVSGSPASFVVAGQWPHAELAGPPAAEYAQLIARRLQELTASNHNTIRQTLRGGNWADLVTLAHLESLDAELWPSGDRRPRAGQERPN